MLRHLRYLSFISFIIVLATALFMGGYFRYVISNGIIKDTVEKNAVALEHFFIKNMWEHNQELVKKLSGQSNIPLWNNTKEGKALLAEVARYAADMPVINLRLYNKAGMLILTSNRLDVKARDHFPYGAAMVMNRFFPLRSREDALRTTVKDGKVTSQIIPYAILSKPDNTIQNIAVIQTFIPVVANIEAKAGLPANVAMVVEVSTDITDLWRYLFYFQVIGTLGVIIIFSVIYGVVFYSFSKIHAIPHPIGGIRK